MSRKARKVAAQLRTEDFRIEGMECGSCEKIIGRQAKSIDGVVEIKADYTKGEGTVMYDPKKTSINKIFAKINDKGYSCSLSDETEKSGVKSAVLLVGLVALLIGAYFVLGSLDFQMPALDQNTSLALLFTIGLLTGFHCVAMCGGFVVSYTAKDAAKQGGLNLRSHLTYGAGKTLSYAVIGAVFGFIGSLFTFTPFMRGVVALVAGFFLIMFGLNMLDLFKWFRRFRLKTPDFVEKFVSKGNNSSPLAVGLLNGLMIACGPLQAVYLFAAASGSPYYGALYLAVFGLGTLPVLLGFGLLTSVVSSKLTRSIVRYSGVVVVLLGLIMVNRGVALAGLGYDFNTVVVSAQGANVAGQNAVTVNNGFQEIRMNVTRYGWVPDKFVLTKGIPVKWIIDGQEITSCNKAIQVPKLGLRFDIKKGLQTIEFTPTEAGTIPWSCWMGMIPGTFIVVEDNGAAASAPASSGAAYVQTTPTTNALAVGSGGANQNVNTPVQDSSGYQVIRMNVTASGWNPNKFVLKTGVPVKWIIDGQELTGCNSGIQVPSLGLRFNIKPGLQTIEFTPNQAGNVQWSCLMGMIKGVFVVKDDVDVNNPAQVSRALNSVQLPKSSGGCGCGMM